MDTGEERWGGKRGLEPEREEGQEEWGGGRGLDRVPHGPEGQQEASAGQSHLRYSSMAKTPWPLLIRPREGPRASGALRFNAGSQPAGIFRDRQMLLCAPAFPFRTL